MQNTLLNSAQSQLARNGVLLDAAINDPSLPLAVRALLSDIRRGEKQTAALIDGHQRGWYRTESAA
jgi:hypothetical protein